MAFSGQIQFLKSGGKNRLLLLPNVGNSGNVDKGFGLALDPACCCGSQGSSSGSNPSGSSSSASGSSGSTSSGGSTGSSGSTGSGSSGSGPSGLKIVCAGCILGTLPSALTLIITGITTGTSVNPNNPACPLCSSLNGGWNCPFQFCQSNGFGLYQGSYAGMFCATNFRTGDQIFVPCTFSPSVSFGVSCLTGVGQHCYLRVNCGISVVVPATANSVAVTYGVSWNDDYPNLICTGTRGRFPASDLGLNIPLGRDCLSLSAVTSCTGATGGDTFCNTSAASATVDF